MNKNYFTKRDLKKFIQYNFYEVFNSPYQRFKDLVYNSFIGEKNEALFLYAIKYAGKMFTYNREIVPIEVYLLKNGRGELYIRYIAHTIDDGSQGFFKKVSSKEEYKLFLLNIIKPYLDSFSRMPSNQEFIEAFREYDVEFDFD